MPRIAYLPDSFHEVNGVAHTSRNYAAYARRRGMPFLCIRASADRGSAWQAAAGDGKQRTLDLRRSRLSVRMEQDLWFDPLFWRHHDAIERELRAFRPDVIHITGPSELGLFGAYFARRHRIKLAASWHTNVHEYAARRLDRLTNRMPAGAQLSRGIQATALAAAAQLYRSAKVLFAPNSELCSMIERATGKPCHLMQRGVDTDLFTPTRRRRACACRQGSEGEVVLGYVGRLSVEKNVAHLVQIERELLALGITGIRFVIVGHGNEEQMLRRELASARFAGVLRGEALANAYADMDLLVFPSHTDTFGNVVLEALASGVPAIVTPDGGPKYIVRDGETGCVVPDAEFAGTIARLAWDRARMRAMGRAAREDALHYAWDAVFGRVVRAYGVSDLPADEGRPTGAKRRREAEEVGAEPSIPALQAGSAEDRRSS